MNDASDATSHTTRKNGLRAGLSFSTFVEGPGNRTALAAARTLAETDDCRFNPLYIHGGAGMGKTHLMHAIGHAMLANDPDARVLIISGEQFVNELVDAIKQAGLDEFRERLLTLDILLVDAIDFLAGKERSSEELLAIATTLVKGRRQLVVASDRKATIIRGLDERITNLLSDGLSVRIGPPDLETRLRILDQQAQMLGLNLSINVALLIIEVVGSNVRELEGALRRVIACANFEGVPVSLDSAERALAGLRAG